MIGEYTDLSTLFSPRVLGTRQARIGGSSKSCDFERTAFIVSILKCKEVYIVNEIFLAVRGQSTLVFADCTMISVDRSRAAQFIMAKKPLSPVFWWLLGLGV